MPLSMPRARRSVLVTNRSSPTSWQLGADAPRSAASSRAQSSSAMPSSMETIGIAARRGRRDSLAMPPASRDLPSPSSSYLPSLKNSVAAQSSASMTSLARLVARLLDRLHDEAQRLVGRLEVGRKAALVADVGVVAGVLAGPSSGCGRSRSPCAWRRANVGAPTGMIMNSWMSMGLSAWAPPLTMFIIGTGSTWAWAPPM